jgi:hypothetical protein
MWTSIRNAALAGCLVIGTGGAAFAQAAGGAAGGGGSAGGMSGGMGTGSSGMGTGSTNPSTSGSGGGAGSGSTNGGNTNTGSSMGSGSGMQGNSMTSPRLHGHRRKRRQPALSLRDAGGLGGRHVCPSLSSDINRLPCLPSGSTVRPRLSMQGLP